MENIISQKEKAPNTVAPVGAFRTGQSSRKFSAKSTATEAQYERILIMLRIGARSTFEFRKAGIMAPAARIKELNDRHGYVIPTVERRDMWDDEGFLHPRVAVYELHSEPVASGVLIEPHD